MRVDRKELEIELEAVIDKVKHERNTILEMEKILGEHHMKPSFFDDISLGNVKIFDLDYTELFILTDTLFQVTGNKMIYPKRFFHDSEIDRASRYQEIQEEHKLTYPIILENVIMLTPTDYVTAMTAKQIKQWNDSNLLQYNFETQRNAKLIRNKKTIIQAPNVNQRSVKDIKEKLKNNAFYADTLRFNILSDGDDDVVYDPKKMQLIINSGEIDVVDGFHRLQGLLAALEEDEIDFVFEVSFKNYPVRRAQQYVAQINTINKMDKTHLQALTADRYSDMIVKTLQRDSDLKGKILQTSRMTYGAGYLTNFTILSDAINDIFKPENKMDVTEISEFLTKFFDYLLGIYDKQFVTDVDEIRANSYINNHNMFVGYVTLAKRFYDNQIPVKNIKKVLDHINFDKSNSDLAEIMKSSNKDNAKKMRQKIIGYFDQIQIDEQLKGSVVS